MTPVSAGHRSGPRMNLRMEGLPESAAMLQEAAARGEDMRPAMYRVGLLFQEGHREQFATHGAYLGTPWPANSEETLLRKARSGVPGLQGVLVEEGALQQAVQGGSGGFLRARRGSVSVGVKDYKAIFAQAGAEGKGDHSKASRGARRGSEPARPILGISESESRESLRILTSYLLGR
jgi:Phage virion morphogenesis family